MYPAFVAASRWPPERTYSSTKTCLGLVKLVFASVVAYWHQFVSISSGAPIAEYKPARDELREWHTDGSFLPRPKAAMRGQRRQRAGRRRATARGLLALLGRQFAEVEEAFDRHHLGLQSGEDADEPVQKVGER